MKKVDKLVALAVLGAVGMVWLLITGFDAFRAFLTATTDIGKGGFSTATALSSVMLSLPRRAYEWFVFAALIGSLLGLGTLAASGELTALRAAGLSKLRICLSVALSLAFLTLLVTVMGETVAPAGEQKSQALALQAKTSDIALAKGSGAWARDGDSVIHFQRGSAKEGADGRSVILTDVRVFEFSDIGQLTAISLAKTAVHAHGAWTMHDVRRTEFDGAGAKSTTSATTEWKSGLDPRLLALTIIQPEYVSARDLWRSITYKKANHLDAEAVNLEKLFWTRVYYPFNVLLLAFAAVPFAFGALRSGGLGKRLFLGMVMAVTWHFGQRALVSFGAVYGVPLALANLVPALILAVLVTTYFRRNA